MPVVNNNLTITATVLSAAKKTNKKLSTADLKPPKDKCPSEIGDQKRNNNLATNYSGNKATAHRPGVGTANQRLADPDELYFPVVDSPIAGAMLPTFKVHFFTFSYINDLAPTHREYTFSLITYLRSHSSFIYFSTHH